MSDFIEKIKASGLWTGTGCTEDQLTEAQNTLGLTFPPDFAEYFRTIGIMDGWTGLGKYKRTGNDIDRGDNTVTRTLMEREVNPDFPANMFIIYDPGYETICFAADENGKVYFIEDDFCEQRFDSLAEYPDYFIRENSEDEE